jgi:hypothetical protein
MSELTATGHNITIADPSLPVLNVGTISNPSYLPIQVCNVRPGQVAQSKISPQQTAQMIKFAVRQPSANARSITTVGLSLLQLERNDAVSTPRTPEQEMVLIERSLLLSYP